MTLDAATELQRAIVATLEADNQVMALVGGVHDRPPAGAALPYISLGGGLERDWSSKTFGGREHRLLLHVWSAALGQSEVKTIMAAVHDALHDQPLSLTGHRLVNLRFEFAEILQEADPPLTHCAMRFRAVTQQDA